MARLIVNPGTPTVWETNLKEGINTVGRGQANDIVINEPSISGAHCHIILSGDSLRLKDLGSTNGTFLNRAPVTEATVQPGQRIHLGSVEVLFENGLAPTAATAAAPAVAAPPIPRPIIRVQTPGGLRISGKPAEPEPSPAEAEADAALTEGPPALQPEASSNAPCKYHPKSPARWVCSKCHKTFCDLCVTTRPAVGKEQKFCRSCGGSCAPLQVRLEAPRQKSFFRELPRAIVYPFRGTGILILIVATLLFAALDFISRGLIGILMKAVALGYLFSYVQNIIHSTAAEDEQMPELPGMDDVFGGFFRLLGTVLISFGPALVLAYLAIFQEQPAAGIALIPAVIFGCLYFPMAFLAVAIKDNVMAANPLVVVPSIVRVPLEYLVAAILLAGLFGIRWMGDALSSGMAHESLMTTSMTEMFLMFGFRAIWAFISVYLLTVTMRILGLLYLTKRDRLGW
jgi:hypothetical protein